MLLGYLLWNEMHHINRFNAIHRIFSGVVFFLLLSRNPWKKDTKSIQLDEIKRNACMSVAKNACIVDGNSFIHIFSSSYTKSPFACELTTSWCIWIDALGQIKQRGAQMFIWLNGIKWAKKQHETFAMNKTKRRMREKHPLWKGIGFMLSGTLQ